LIDEINVCLLKKYINYTARGKVKNEKIGLFVDKGQRILLSSSKGANIVKGQLQCNCP